MGVPPMGRVPSSAAQNPAGRPGPDRLSRPPLPSFTASFSSLTNVCR